MIFWKSAGSAAPRSVIASVPSMHTGPVGCSLVPGSEMPMSDMLGLAGPVDDAAYDRDGEPGTARIARLRSRYGIANKALDIGCKLPNLVDVVRPQPKYAATSCTKVCRPTGSA